MPELYSRTDDVGWLTPSIADVLEQGAPPPGGDGSIRDHMLTIQRELADMETPAKIINVRSMPSYTLYVARPETIGRLGSRRTVTAQEIRRSLARIVEQHPDWALGFIPKLEEDENAIGILLRTQAHRPLSLRRLLVRGSFRMASAFHTYTLGITLEQQLIVRDLNTTPHLLVIGRDNAKVHFLRSVLLTLLVLNTPSELRVILAGSGVESLRALIASPHSLGRAVNQADALHRILVGLQTESQRRSAVFSELGVSDIEAYNTLARERGRYTLPRIVVLVDSLADDVWQPMTDALTALLESLLQTPSAMGLHFILTMPEMNDFQPLRQRIHTHILLRTIAKALADRIPDFHVSLLRFVDAVIADYEGDRTTLTPVELCSTTNTELINAVTYWQQNRQARRQEQKADLPFSGRTGVTDLLSLPGDMTVEDMPASTGLTGPLRPIAEAVPTASNPPFSEPIPEAAPMPEALALAPNATALAAYLGWLSAGALQDIFGIDADHAAQLMIQLQRSGILEESPYATPRFLRR